MTPLRERERVVLRLEFTLDNGDILRRDYSNRNIKSAPPWLADGPPPWIVEGTDEASQQTPASPHVLTGRVVAGEEGAARRALGLGRSRRR